MSSATTMLLDKINGLLPDSKPSKVDVKRLSPWWDVITEYILLGMLFTVAFAIVNDMKSNGVSCFPSERCIFEANNISKLCTEYFHNTENKDQAVVMASFAPADGFVTDYCKGHFNQHRLFATFLLLLTVLIYFVITFWQKCPPTAGMAESFLILIDKCKGMNLTDIELAALMSDGSDLIENLPKSINEEIKRENDNIDSSTKESFSKLQIAINRFYKLYGNKHVLVRIYVLRIIFPALIGTLITIASIFFYSDYKIEFNCELKLNTSGGPKSEFQCVTTNIFVDYISISSITFLSSQLVLVSILIGFYIGVRFSCFLIRERSFLRERGARDDPNLLLYISSSSNAVDADTFHKFTSKKYLAKEIINCYEENLEKFKIFKDSEATDLLNNQEEDRV